MVLASHLGTLQVLKVDYLLSKAPHTIVYQLPDLDIKYYHDYNRSRALLGTTLSELVLSNLCIYYQVTDQGQLELPPTVGQLFYENIAI